MQGKATTTRGHCDTDVAGAWRTPASPAPTGGRALRDPLLFLPDEAEVQRRARRRLSRGSEQAAGRPSAFRRPVMGEDPPPPRRLLPQLRRARWPSLEPSSPLVPREHVTSGVRERSAGCWGLRAPPNSTEFGVPWHRAASFVNWQTIGRSRIFCHYEQALVNSLQCVESLCVSLFVGTTNAHPDSPPARLEKVFLGNEETWGSGNRGPLPGQGSGRPRASAGSSRAEAS